MGIYDGFKFNVQTTSPGSETRKCQTGQVAVVNYTGKLRSNGNVFDSTDKKG